MEGLILTLPFPVQREGFPDPLPVERLMMRECLYSIKTRVVFIPSALEISLDALSVVGDGFPNTSLVLVEHGYNVVINNSAQNFYSQT